LEKEEMIVIQNLTDYHYQLLKEITDIANKFGFKILEELYTKEERENYVPEISFGAKIKDEKPYFFYDSENKPLNGKYKFRNELFMKDGIYQFSNGEMLSKNI
jgi:hypothetical protein